MLHTKTLPIAEITRGLSLPVYEGTTKETVEAIDQHNDRASRLVESVAQIDAAVEAAANAVGDDPGEAFADLSNELENRRFATTDLLAQAARLWRQRTELATKQVEELRPRIELAETTHDKALAKTIAGLAKLGIVPEAMQAGGWNAGGGVNLPAAQQQLRHLASHALPVREAFAAMNDCKARVSAATEQVAASKRGEAVAKEAAKSRAAKMAAAFA
ncbi:hypothetical protein Pla108_40870 [Botrimarina colliarenosi]|uniref:Uncharacterized protein n=1 Tax=Botrimarina colliarenosi TaxID=2528001 RepID=A0A5C5ZZK4_9BACT|nr:hypothetical protein [Botrimarina colliarenosi]TWT92461.1 hypothetical protein Pla108_40870 [Botrimarina colliarenosi]